jgi:hypothetical protein
MQSITNVILSLRGIVSEPVRCLIARRFASAIHRAIADEDGRKRFLERGMADFLYLCKVKDGNPVVPDDLNVEATDLARFCDRWMTVQAFREPGVRGWSGITPEMNSIRCVMVNELQALADGMTIDELNKS